MRGEKLVKSPWMPPFFFVSDAERFLSNMSHYSLARVYFKKRRDVVKAFDVIVGRDHSNEFDECCGRECKCCRKGTLLPCILLVAFFVSTFISQGIYLWAFTWNYVPQPMMLPTLVGFPIIGFILVFWLEAFAPFLVNSLQSPRNNLKYAKCGIGFTVAMLWLMIFIAGCQVSGWMEELTSLILIGILIALVVIMALGMLTYKICKIALVRRV
jgi:hypothetical protein